LASVHLGSRASGGAGLIIQEATCFQKAEFSRRFRALEDEQIEKMQQINRFIIGQNSVPGIQLAHAGRKASAAYHGKAVRNLILLMGLEQRRAIIIDDETPIALDKSGIKSDLILNRLPKIREGRFSMEIHERMVIYCMNSCRHCLI
jgi:2,4-dienoyl-CoA reductase-like NADH-dependent reductase (Old Yellow Enzyme family)